MISEPIVGIGVLPRSITTTRNSDSSRDFSRTNTDLPAHTIRGSSSTVDSKILYLEK